MKTSGLTLKIVAVVNAILLTTAFVACPACKSRETIPLIPPTISIGPTDLGWLIPTMSPPSSDSRKVMSPCPETPPETKNDR